MSTEKLKAIGLAVLSAVVLTARTDYSAYRKALQENPNLSFNWKLFGARMVEAVLGGVILGAGWDAVA